MPLPAFLAAGSMLRKFAIPLIIAAAVALLLTLTYCEGKKSGKAGADISTLKGNQKTLEKKGKADDSAAGQRLEDAGRQTQEQAELEKVTQNATDPTSRRRAFHRCLRDQQAARKAGRPAPVCE